MDLLFYILYFFVIFYFIYILLIIYNYIKSSYNIMILITTFCYNICKFIADKMYKLSEYFLIKSEYYEHELEFQNPFLSDDIIEDDEIGRNPYYTDVMLNSDYPANFTSIIQTY